MHGAICCLTLLIICYRDVEVNQSALKLKHPEPINAVPIGSPFIYPTASIHPSLCDYVSANAGLVGQVKFLYNMFVEHMFSPLFKK